MSAALASVLPLGAEFAGDSELAELRAVLLEVAPLSRAKSTASQYAAPWARITEWCAERGASAPPLRAHRAASGAGRAIVAR